MATVIVLNGTSSSGKTTLARAFQAIAPRLFLNFSIDNILYALPVETIDRISRGADISDLDLPRLVGAFYGCVKQLLGLGHDLVIDHAVTARYHADLLLSAVEGHDAVLIGIDCSLTTLNQREMARGDRRVGMAEQQMKSIHTWLAYDAVIDTSAMTPADAARRVVEVLSGGRREGIAKTRERLRQVAQEAEGEG